MKELSKKRLGVDARFTMECSTNDCLGKIPIGLNPKNQMINLRKIPNESISPKIL